jgi:hypothetical protein
MDSPTSPRLANTGKKMSRREMRKSLNLSSSCLAPGFSIPPAEGFSLPRDRKGKTEIHYEVEKVSTGKLVELLEKNPKEVRAPHSLLPNSDCPLTRFVLLFAFVLCFVYNNCLLGCRHTD